MNESGLSRRQWIQSTALFAAVATGPRAAYANDGDVQRWIASPPEGFRPLRSPGLVVKATQGTDVASLMQTNQLWPKPEVARSMFGAAMTKLTGMASTNQAMAKFIHPGDSVAIKVNGIGGQSGFTMATNFELILPLVESVLSVGVPADKVVVYEQFPNFLSGTRINIRGNRLPHGVKALFHSNTIADMPPLRVSGETLTRYCRFLTQATAVISVSLIKDHSICGYTGTMKNITHGSIVNPQDHHKGNADPHIALLYGHPIVTSRMRLHIVDGFKMIYDEGPLDKNPRRRILHGSVYASTDPVALDTIGWQVVEDARKQHGLKSLQEVGREPTYLRTAGSMGLGVSELKQIQLREVNG